MTLYHFTCLFNLPPIHKEGLRLGEVPLSPTQRANAVNLTTNPNPSAQTWRRGSVMDKTKVRLTVRLADADPSLQPWREFCKKQRVNKEWLQRLDPIGQGKFWYLYFGTIDPQLIQTVEIFADGAYQIKAGDELENRIASIEEERAKFEIRGDFVRLKEGIKSSWLLDG